MKKQEDNIEVLKMKSKMLDEILNETPEDSVLDSEEMMYAMKKDSVRNLVLIHFGRPIRLLQFCPHMAQEFGWDLIKLAGSLIVCPQGKDAIAYSKNYERVLRKGEIVQLNPEYCKPVFAGCLMVIEEVHPWGAQGYVQALGRDDQPGGQVYYRATWAEMELTFGKVIWLTEGELIKEWEGHKPLDTG
jgi:hypothetical protein